jgi:hypothetical protein
VPSAASTEWPPLSPTSNRPEPRQPEPRKPEPRKPEASKSEARTTPATTADTAVEAPRWLPPVNGTNPEGYPVKANDTSRIFHVPGGRFYDRTVAERCYATPEDAIADGYRQAKA